MHNAHHAIATWDEIKVGFLSVHWERRLTEKKIYEMCRAHDHVLYLVQTRTQTSFQAVNKK